MKKIKSIMPVFLISIPALIYAQGYGNCAFQGRNLTGPGIMWIILILMIGVLVFIAVQFSRQRKLTESNETPLDILKRRYASGEINKEEFDSLKSDLK